LRVKVRLHIVVCRFGCWIEAEANFFELFVDFSSNNLPGKFVSVHVGHNEYGLHSLTKDEEPIIVNDDEVSDFFQAFDVFIFSIVNVTQPLVKPCEELNADIWKVAHENDDDKQELPRDDLIADLLTQTFA